MLTIQSLIGIWPRGWGQEPQCKSQFRPFLKWCMEKDIHLTVQQVKRSEDLADGPSRWSQDKGDYTMDKSLFYFLLGKMKKKNIVPKVDMFASPGNHQLPKFVSRYPHWQAMEVDALKCPLNNISCCYANPPWSVIGKWLQRLRVNKHLTWISAPWWPQLIKLQVRVTPAFLIPPNSRDVQ